MTEHLDRWDTYRLCCISATNVNGSCGDESELHERLGIVEGYLTDYDSLYREMHKELLATYAQEINRTLADEAEERRFLQEDAAWLPWKLFVETSYAQALELVAGQEAQVRHSIVAAYAASLMGLLLPFEELQRMRLTWEALDSLALKACIVGRYGVREGQLARTSIPGYVYGSTFPPSASEAAAAAAVRRLLTDEWEERQGILLARRQYVATSLLSQAFDEKCRSFASAALSGMPTLPRLRGNRPWTARQALDVSATSIQSAYRGYRARAVRATS
ncbi:hypothetical protein JKF63_02214 [Porcisia hertigi]|uniref:Uncharacterized protein n=1 Tax=Porcisia hertigi TaxID=2761500 RepID=A0A836IGX7_9TRYP|nr:hypothetical protein JKF63_02214 [Porcisia hertigi]